MEVQNDEIPLKELIEKKEGIVSYLLSQWKVIVLARDCRRWVGSNYSFSKPVYTASLSCFGR
jgi:hypothetical protein